MLKFGTEIDMLLKIYFFSVVKSQKTNHPISLMKNTIH